MKKIIFVVFIQGEDEIIEVKEDLFDTSVCNTEKKANNTKISVLKNSQQLGSNFRHCSQMQMKFIK